jgi:hypothetical protein
MGKVFVLSPERVPEGSVIRPNTCYEVLQEDLYGFSFDCPDRNTVYYGLWSGDHFLACGAYGDWLRMEQLP